MVVLDNPTNTENLDKFVSLPSVTILRSPEPVENDRALMFALRSLRGTIREEDLIITAHSEKNRSPSDLQFLLQPLLEETYDSKKVITLNDATNFSAFRGWTVHYGLPEDRFSKGLRNGLRNPSFQRHKAYTPDFSLFAPLKQMSLSHWDRRLQKVLGFRLLLLFWGVTLLVLLIRPGYAALIDIFG